MSAILVALFVVACSSPAIGDKRFELVELRASAQVEADYAALGRPLWLHFQQGALGAGGCNSIVADGGLEQGRLVFRPHYGKTILGCSREGDRLDNWFFDFLQSAPLARLEDGELLLTSDSATLVLVDRSFCSGEPCPEE